MTTAFVTCAAFAFPAITPIFHNTAFMWIVIVIYFGTFCALICCNLHRSVPTNYILLGVFTIAVSCMVASISTRYAPMIVIEATLLTAAVVVGITVYAFVSKTDYTMCGPLCYIFMMILAVSLIISFVFPFTWNTMYCILGTIAFSFYLLCDTQRILGGKHRKYTFSEDDYILAALVIYLDIINIFIFILEMLGSR